MDIELKQLHRRHRAAFWIATSSSVSTHLIPDDAGTDYKVIRRARRSYDEIASVDFRKSWGTRNIAIRFKTGSTTFTGNAVNDEAARRGLAGLRDKGCALTARAFAFADGA